MHVRLAATALCAPQPVGRHQQPGRNPFEDQAFLIVQPGQHGNDRQSFKIGIGMPDDPRFRSLMGPTSGEVQPLSGKISCRPAAHGVRPCMPGDIGRIAAQPPPHRLGLVDAAQVNEALAQPPVRVARRRLGPNFRFSRHPGGHTARFDLATQGTLESRYLVPVQGDMTRSR